MKYCYKCGNLMQDDSGFCGKCGASAKAEQQGLDSGRLVEKRAVLSWAGWGLTVICFATMVCYFVFPEFQKTGANRPNAGNAVTQKQLNTAKAVETAASGQQSGKAHTVTLAVIDDFHVYVQAKERLNTDIIELASQINNRIGQTGGLYSSQDLKNRAQQLIRDIDQYSGQLSGKSYPPELQSAKSLLLQLFDLEMTRTRSLYNGIVEGSNGQNYQSSFSVGTSAAYKFDEVNSNFIEANVMLDSLISR